jgi:hypothetical protein
MHSFPHSHSRSLSHLLTPCTWMSQSLFFATTSRKSRVLRPLPGLKCDHMDPFPITYWSTFIASQSALVRASPYSNYETTKEGEKTHKHRLSQKPINQFEFWYADTTWFNVIEKKLKTSKAMKRWRLPCPGIRTSPPPVYFVFCRENEFHISVAQKYSIEYWLVSFKNNGNQRKERESVDTHLLRLGFVRFTNIGKVILSIFNQLLMKNTASHKSETISSKIAIMKHTYFVLIEAVKLKTRVSMWRRKRVVVVVVVVSH